MSNCLQFNLNSVNLSGRNHIFNPAFQFPIIFEVKNKDDGKAVEGFEVEIDGKKEELDGVKTKTLFDMDAVLKVIKVMKVGLMAPEVKDYKVVNGENKVVFEMEIAKVRLIDNSKFTIWTISIAASANL